MPTANPTDVTALIGDTPLVAPPSPNPRSPFSASSRATTPAAPPLASGAANDENGLLGGHVYVSFKHPGSTRPCVITGAVAAGRGSPRIEKQNNVVA